MQGTVAGVEVTYRETVRKYVRDIERESFYASDQHKVERRGGSQ